MSACSLFIYPRKLGFIRRTGGIGDRFMVKIDVKSADVDRGDPRGTDVTRRPVKRHFTISGKSAYACGREV